MAQRGKRTASASAGPHHQSGQPHSHTHHSQQPGHCAVKRRKCRLTAHQGQTQQSPLSEEDDTTSARPGNGGATGSSGGSGQSGGSGGSGQQAWTPRPLADIKISSIYNRSSAEAPAELFRKDLISAMKLPDSEPLAPQDYWVITDQWKQEWERGVQVPVNPDSLPEPAVSLSRNPAARLSSDFKLPKKFVRISRDDHFNSEDHHLSTTPARAEKQCAYDLDDTDIAWLELLNGERAQMGQMPVTESQLERVIEELEVRCWERIQTIVKNEEGLGIEYDENVICDVCRSPDSEEGNEMVFCDCCNICVHQACYGITSIPDGSWLCRTCSLSQRPDCVLCPNKGGAMKCTRSGQKWAHVSCALWIPEVSIGCVERMEPITKISSIPQSRWALICVLCRERVGACIQCSIKTCKTAYHVTCAFKFGLEMKAIIEDEMADDGVKLRSYCQKHSRTNTKDKVGHLEKGSDSEDQESRRRKRKDMTSEEKNQARAAKLQEIEAEFDKHVGLKDVSGQQVDVDHDALVYIYNYWKLKRRAGHNKPLLAPRCGELALPSPRAQSQSADLEKMRTFVQLRQDLERVRNLCYMVGRREKLCRSFLRLREQTFHKQALLISGPPLSPLATSAIIEANHGPSIYDRLYSHNEAEDHTKDFDIIIQRIAGDEEGDRKMEFNGKKMYFNGSKKKVYASDLSSVSGSENDNGNVTKCIEKSEKSKKARNLKDLETESSTDDDVAKLKPSKTAEKSEKPEKSKKSKNVKEVDSESDSDNKEILRKPPRNIEKVEKKTKSEKPRVLQNLESDSSSDDETLKSKTPKVEVKVEKGEKTEKKPKVMARSLKSYDSESNSEEDTGRVKPSKSTEKLEKPEKNEKKSKTLLKSIKTLDNDSSSDEEALGSKPIKCVEKPEKIEKGEKQEKDKKQKSNVKTIKTLESNTSSEEEVGSSKTFRNSEPPEKLERVEKSDKKAKLGLKTVKSLESETSSEEEDPVRKSKAKLRKRKEQEKTDKSINNRSNTLQHMEKELGSSASDSDELLTLGSHNKHGPSVASAIYSDTDSDSQEQTSSQAVLITKAAVKQFSASDLMKNSKKESRKKEMISSALIVPQRQAAKKASEIMQRSQTKKDAVSEEPKVEPEEKIIPKKEKTIKKRPENRKEGKNNDVYDFDKEFGDLEILAYVPQRQAAKKAAETIKSGLGSKTVIEPENSEAKAKKELPPPVPQEPVKKPMKKEEEPKEDKKVKKVKKITEKKVEISSNSDSSSSSSSSCSSSSDSSSECEGNKDDNKSSSSSTSSESEESPATSSTKSQQSQKSPVKVETPIKSPRKIVEVVKKEDEEAKPVERKKKLPERKLKTSIPQFQEKEKEKSEVPNKSPEKNPEKVLDKGQSRAKKKPEVESPPGGGDNERQRNQTGPRNIRKSLQNQKQPPNKLKEDLKNRNDVKKRKNEAEEKTGRKVDRKGEVSSAQTCNLKEIANKYDEISQKSSEYIKVPDEYESNLEDQIKIYEEVLKKPDPPQKLEETLQKRIEEPQERQIEERQENLVNVEAELEERKNKKSSVNILEEEMKQRRAERDSPKKSVKVLDKLLEKREHLDKLSRSRNSEVKIERHSEENTEEKSHHVISRSQEKDEVKEEDRKNHTNEAQPELLSIVEDNLEKSRSKKTTEHLSKSTKSTKNKIQNESERTKSVEEEAEEFEKLEKRKKSIFSPQPTKDPSVSELFDFDQDILAEEMVNDDGFGIGRDPEERNASLSFSFNNELWFKEDSKEDSARETLHLVEKLRMELSKKSNSSHVEIESDIKKEENDILEKPEVQKSEMKEPEVQPAVEVRIEREEVEETRREVEEVEKEDQNKAPDEDKGSKGYPEIENRVCYTESNDNNKVTLAERSKLDRAASDERWVPPSGNFEPNEMQLNTLIEPQNHRYNTQFNEQYILQGHSMLRSQVQSMPEEMSQINQMNQMNPVEIVNRHLISLQPQEDQSDSLQDYRSSSPYNDITSIKQDNRWSESQVLPSRRSTSSSITSASSNEEHSIPPYKNISALNFQNMDTNYYSESTSYAGAVSLFPSQNLNFSGASMLPPPFGAPFPTSNLIPHVKPIEDFQNLQASPCAAAFTSSSHNMALTAAMVSPTKLNTSSENLGNEVSAQINEVPEQINPGQLSQINEINEVAAPTGEVAGQMSQVPAPIEDDPGSVTGIAELSSAIPVPTDQISTILRPGSQINPIPGPATAISSQVADLQGPSSQLNAIPTPATQINEIASLPSTIPAQMNEIPVVSSQLTTQMPNRISSIPSQLCQIPGQLNQIPSQALPANSLQSPNNFMNQIENENIENMVETQAEKSPQIGKKSPSKPTRTSARVSLQNKSPGKSPRQENNKIVSNQRGRGRSSNKNQSSNYRGRGRGRGRGRAKTQNSILSNFNDDSIQNKLVGTVYDFDSDEDSNSEANIADLRMMRERKKSVEAERKDSLNNLEGPEEVSRKLEDKKSSPVAENLAGNDQNINQNFDTVLPVLPGPVDMRTYNSSLETSTYNSSTETFSNHLLPAFSSPQIPYNSDLKSPENKKPQTQDLEENNKVSLTDSRNQLKVKIKGPFLDANYVGASTVPPLAQQAPVIIAPTASNGSVSGGTSNLRRMRKKELLRQYCSQDMNMDDPITSAASAPITMPPISRTVITIPKAVASMTTIPTREDYKAVVDANMEKKRRKERGTFDQSEDEARAVGQLSSEQRRRIRGQKPIAQNSSNAPPKLKIKIGGGLVAHEQSVNEDSRIRPPKKRLSSITHTPSIEELRRESMKFRRMIMAGFDNDEKSLRIKSKKDKNGKKKRRQSNKKEARVRILEDGAATPKLIIKLGKIPTEDSADYQESQQQQKSKSSTEDDAQKGIQSYPEDTSTSEKKPVDPNTTVSKNVRSAKVTPIRLKFSRCQEGYELETQVAPPADLPNEEKEGNTENVSEEKSNEGQFKVR